MKKLASWVFSGCFSAVAIANEPVGAPELTAAQIVEKNVAARGGAEAWRMVQSMVWVGHIERQNAPSPGLPFALEMKRPNKTRFEINAQNQMSVRLYDGSSGWKMRAGSAGVPEVSPFSTEELNFARDGQGIDGPLMDHEAKGIVVALDGTEDIDGREAYRLSVKLPSGANQYVWIDAQTFLDVRYDRQTRNASGRPGMVSVLYRDYRTVDGLQVPFVIENGSGDEPARDKMVIARVALNLPVDDHRFEKPELPGPRAAVSVGSGPSQAGSRPGQRPPAPLLRFSRTRPTSATGLAGVH